MDATQRYELDNCRLELGKKIHAALAALLNGNAANFSAESLGRLLEQPPDTTLGDYALPCFRFAKELRLPPAKVASDLAATLSKDGWVDRAVATNAFLNIFVNPRQLATAVLDGAVSGTMLRQLANTPANRNTRVMIEYSQPNTHKEFHVGHTRNVCLGNALVHLFRACGYQVASANYLGDDGTHIATVLWYLLQNKLEAPKEQRGAWLGSMYAQAKKAVEEQSKSRAAEVQAELSAVHRQIESKQGDTYKLWQDTRAWSLEAFDEIYAWLDVNFDFVFFESEMTEEAQAIVDEFLAKGLFVLDQGAIGMDLKPHKLGFCILRKSDGNTLYATKDLALARRKFKNHSIDRSINVVASEQNHHFKQVFKILELMGFEQAKQCYHLSYGLVMLPEGKMSSRDGTSVSFDSLRQLMISHLLKILEKYRGEWSDQEINEAAHRLCDGAIKYGMIATDPAKEIIFNLEDWLSFDGNSGPYLMYSYTRAQSVLRKAQEINAAPQNLPDELSEPSELALLRYLYDFPAVVAQAAETYRPSHLATHLYYMCKALNRFYADVSVLKAETEAKRGARLALLQAFAHTLKAGLALLGITPPERM